MKKVYIAGPYTGKDYYEIDKHIDAAEEVAVKLANAGIGFFCPHTHTAHFEAKSIATEDFYKELDEDFLKACDAILLIPGWMDSHGSQLERNIAHSLGIPVFQDPQDYEKMLEWYRNG